MTGGFLDISFCWPVAGNVPPERGLPFLKKCGFEGIELWPQTIKQFGVSGWKRALKEAGMRCFQLCPYFDFVSGQEKLNLSREILGEYLAISSQLSNSRLRVFTGPPWGPGMVGSEHASERQWRDAMEGLRGMCDLAPTIEFCLECHEGLLMDTSHSTRRLLGNVDRPNLTVNLQLPLAGEEWRHSVGQLGPYTTHIHIHNWTRGLGLGELTFLSKGAFDWKPVIRRLLDMGRRVCLSVEHADHHGRHNPWRAAEYDGEFLVALREDLE